MECRLCELPTPTPPIEADGLAFCCFGCMEVYRNFGAGILGSRSAKADDPSTEIAEDENLQEAFLRIEGMHCSSCEFLIERLALKVDGVRSVSSSYATSTAKVVYDPDIVAEADLPAAFNRAGYRARLSRDQAPAYDYRLDLLRLLTGLVLWVIVMMLYVAFFYPSHLGLVDPDDLAPIGWLAYDIAPWAMFYATTVMIGYVGAPIFRGAVIGLRARVLNMDNLLAIAILAAYAYSTARLWTGSLDLYFDVTTTIIAVVTLGRYLERNAKVDATRELSRILDAWAPKARIRWGGDFRLVDIDALEPGEHVIIMEGEPVPVDGTVVHGSAAVDEALMTGEPFPVKREPGDAVLGGSIIVEGRLEIATGATVESRANDLARILWNVQSGNAGAQGFADLVARLFVPLVLVLAVCVAVVTLIAGAPAGAALLAGLATLIVSCPCTFGLAIPLTTAVGVGTALRRGIIVTSADAFEKAPRIDIVALDKTGTLSTGQMTVNEVIGAPETVARAAAVERLCRHPIAKAIARLDDTLSAVDLEVRPGKGAIALVDGRRVAVGSRSLFAALGWTLPDALAAEVTAAAPADGVVSYVGWDGAVYGAIVTRDRSRPEWQQVVDRLRRHCRVVLLTGAEHPSDYDGHVDAVVTGVPPEAKAAVVRQLKTEGTVVMVGDGSNDAPALAAADLGIAFGAPTPLAADAADLVILGDRLDRLFHAFDLVHTVRRRVHQNLGWALLYNAVAIPLAVFGLLNPLFAAIAMSSSSLLVVWNSSRKIAMD